MRRTIVQRIAPTAISDLAGLHPILQQIYAARDVRSCAELEKDLKHLLPYQNLSGMTSAVELLITALNKQQHILVIGDFDADGATSTALAVSALRALGVQQVNYLVPNRFEFGYGLTPEIVQVAAQTKPDMIITVDNGISSFAGVAAAKSLGIKVIITDHHLPTDSLPMADAIINPQLPGDQFASKNLAGVGVIYYLMLALRAELRNQNWFLSQNLSEPNMAQFLDLVALGTVADIVPLDHNNRILVHQGIQRIRAGKARVGIQALLAAAGRRAERLTTMDLGFAIGPRLNAAGRLTDMSLGIECLLTTDLNRAQELAVQLNALNEERRLIEQQMQKQAFAIVDKLKDITPQLAVEKISYGICLFDEEWHQGVIGLLASRVKDYTHRPVIAFAPGAKKELKGSARSIAGLHIRDVLANISIQQPDLIEKFGGHAMAAGLTIKRENYISFSAIFDAEVRRLLKPQDLCAQIETDGQLNTDDFTLAFAELIKEGGPWGQAFPEPVFDGKFKIMRQNLVGGKHLKLCLATENNFLLEAIHFNVDLENWPNPNLEYINLAYRLDINEYRGEKKLQLIIEELAPAS